MIANLPGSPEEYHSLVEECLLLPPEQKAPRYRRWCLSDLYFLIRYGFHRYDIEHNWLFARCREVQEFPNGYLDLWSRNHYKSTIITFALTIQDLLNDPETTVGIFSHTRPIAKSFLRQIKREFEGNEFLKNLFPDILYSNPQKLAPKWSEDDGLIVKRHTNPKESSIEAWGLIDGQPTGKHFKLMVYDDVVTRDSVTTPEMIETVTGAWELSRNLTMRGGFTRYIGTRYHFNDTWGTIIRRQAAVSRIYPATVDGTPDGEPVFLDREDLAEKRREMGPFTFSAQMLLNPIADERQNFKYEWVQYYDGKLNTGEGLNKYILIDPANEKKKRNDYTSLWVIGLGTDGNYYVLDMVRDRLNLTQRAALLFQKHRKWKPLGVGYEKYGMQADSQHIKEQMSRLHYHFGITELGGNMPKPDRIRRLIPLFEQGKIYFPNSLFYTNYEGKTEDLVQNFIEHEYKAFPVPIHDDMLDALARITDEDLGVVWPLQTMPQQGRYKKRPTLKGVSFMSR